MEKKTLLKYILLVVLLQKVSCSFSQAGSVNLFSSGNTSSAKQKDNYSLSLRGKALSFFIIEDTYFSTATIGTELSVKGGHSFGVDLTFFGWQYERDDEKDEPLYETYEKRNYIYLDYKFRFLERKEFDLYFNLYDKIGIYHFWREGVSEGYNDWEQPFLTDKTRGTFNQAGLGIGVKKFFSDRFYLDASVNGGKVFTKDHTLTYDPNTKVSVEEYNVRDNHPVFYIRVNFGYVLLGNYSRKPALLITDK